MEGKGKRGEGRGKEGGVGGVGSRSVIMEEPEGGRELVGSWSACNLFFLHG